MKFNFNLCINRARDVAQSSRFSLIPFQWFVQMSKRLIGYNSVCVRIMDREGALQPTVFDGVGIWSGVWGDLHDDSDGVCSFLGSCSR